MTSLSIKKCVRAAFAVAALAASGLAVAAPTYPGTGAPSTTNNGLAFVVVYNATQSYVEYVGQNFSNFSSSALDTSSGFSYQLDSAAFSSFLSTAGSQPLNYLFFTFDSQSDPGTSAAGTGIRITSSAPAPTLLGDIANPADGGPANGAALKAGQFMGTAINSPFNGTTQTGCALANPCVRTNGQDGYYFGSNNFFSNLGSGGNSVAALLGSTIDFYQFLTTDDDLNGTGAKIVSSAGSAYKATLTQAGLFTLSAGTIGGTEVPLPAAGWLLLSALGGLGAMGRRRKG